MGPDETGGGEIHNSPRKGRDREEVPCDCSTAPWVWGGMNVGGQSTQALLVKSEHFECYPAGNKDPLNLVRRRPQR